MSDAEVGRIIAAHNHLIGYQPEQSTPVSPLDLYQTEQRVRSRAIFEGLR